MARAQRRLTAPGAAPEVRVVLDTNVWLDWLVFDDRSVAPLRAAAADGRIALCIDVACENELERALAYRFYREPLALTVQQACLAACWASARIVTLVPGSSPRLPKCRDPDDQKFLELARDCGAALLVTRDKALLSLAARCSATTGFRIITPRSFECEMAGTQQCA